MTEQRINAYEGLFLFPQAVGGELQFAVDHVTEILAKANAEIISLCKWDERRLSYEIKLRAEQAAATPESAEAAPAAAPKAADKPEAAAGGDGGDKPEVTVETEVAPSDAATT